MTPGASEPVTLEEWRRLSGEEQDALIASGWHPGSPERLRPDGTDGRSHVYRRIERMLVTTPAYVTITASEARDLLGLARDYGLR